MSFLRIDRLVIGCVLLALGLGCPPSESTPLPPPAASEDDRSSRAEAPAVRGEPRPKRAAEQGAPQLAASWLKAVVDSNAAGAEELTNATFTVSTANVVKTPCEAKEGPPAARCLSDSKKWSLFREEVLASWADVEDQLSKGAEGNTFHVTITGDGVGYKIYVEVAASMNVSGMRVESWFYE